MDSSGISVRPRPETFHSDASKPTRNLYMPPAMVVLLRVSARARHRPKFMYDFALKHMQKTNLSPSITEVLRLLASKANEAIQTGATTIDRDALLKEVQEMKVPNESGSTGLETRLGDYGMTYCQKLKDAGDFAFKKMHWTWILDTLVAERYARL